jgi:mono/diheme cytochrome c family protein
MTAGDVALRTSLQPVGGNSTQARIEIAAVSPDHRFDETARAFFDLETRGGDAGELDAEAVWIGSSGFLGEAVVAVPGEWRFALRIEQPDGSTIRGESVFVLPALPLKDDLKPFLSLSAINYSLPGLVTFVVGVLLLLSSSWMLRQSWFGKTYTWLMPVSMANMILGGYLALSVTFVKTYPTTFQTNPEPYNAEVIRKGEAVYREHCEECHGITGKGDGPWAIRERGSIPDLAAPHMDVHTDGEVYWWIIKGIPTLDKPPLAEELSETERWAVINFTRSLRHGLPAE